MKRIAFSLFLSLGLLFLVTPKAQAAGCMPIYGGGETCTDNTLAVQKQVLNPNTNVFVHDLGITDAKYHGNDLVTFQITVSNNGSDTLKKVVIQDVIPSTLIFSDGPGNFNTSNHMLSFEVDNLLPHHAQLYTVDAHVVSQNQFPQNVFCVSNQVTATANNKSVKDSSQMCIEKINGTPSTGPESLGLLALIPTGLLGLGLKKLARK